MKKRAAAVVLAAIALTAVTAGCLEGDTEENDTPQAVEWVSYDTALEQSEATGKPVMVDFYADWCGPCQQMDETTYQNQEVIQKITDSFIAVKVNVDTQGSLASQYGIRSIPTIVYLGDDGSEIHRTLGYRSASQLLSDMNAALQKT